MKKSVGLLFLCVCVTSWSLDWKLPIFTLRYEAAGGAAEDPDEDAFLSSSVRNTVHFQMKEEADPAVFGLALTFSGKDFLLPSDRPGDYSYVKLEQDGAVRIGDSWKLGYDASIKAMDYVFPDAQGFSKDVLATSIGATVGLLLLKGTTIDAGVSGRYAAAANNASSLATWVFNAGLSSRIGSWLLLARCRGELRVPADAALGSDVYATASVALQWDPNR